MSSVEEFTVSVSSSEDAEDAGVVGTLVEIVNMAYSRGEEGMWKGNAKRTTLGEMAAHLKRGEILIARSSVEVAGSIFVNPFFEENIGELGMLCVAEKFLRRGLGKMLVHAAEVHCKSVASCKHMRLELLTPAAYIHPVKAWLDKWYTSMGYVKGTPENFDLHPTLSYTQGYRGLGCKSTFSGVHISLPA